MNPFSRPTVEDSTEALLEGDEYPRGVGTARSALAHREFRLMWFGSFGSNIGTWMQTVVLGAFAYDLTGSAAFVGLLAFAQLGPLLLLSPIIGVLADVVDRRILLIVVQIEQLVFSLLLAVIVATPDPSRVAIVACVVAVGIGNAFNSPTWSAVLPSLVGENDIGAAVSLNSTMINGSRVIGPALAGLLNPIIGPAWIFALNGLTYVAVIAALIAVRFPPVPPVQETGWARLAKGFRVVKANPVVGRIVASIALLSLFCLPFIGLLPTIAERDLGLDSDGLAYGLLYASFGLGACLGGLSIGTVFASAQKMRIVRASLAGFALAITAFALCTSPAAAYPIVFVLGFAYFATTTSMLTVVQMLVADEVRGRVMAIWMMAFGGTISLGALLFGPVLDTTSGHVVLFIGAAVSAALAWWCNLRPLARAARLPVV